MRATNIGFAVLLFFSATIVLFVMYRNTTLLIKLGERNKEVIRLRSELEMKNKCNEEDLFRCSEQLFSYESTIRNFKETPTKLSSRYALLPDEIYDWPKLHKDQDALIEHLKPFGDEVDIKENGMVGPLDQWGLYTMTRYFKPRRIIEIGSGHSTRVLHQAMLANKIDGYKTDITCIEPYRADKIKEELRGDVNVINKQVQDVDVSVFKQLEPGDFLIIDNSHVMQPYGDTILEYTYIVPLVPEGTIVHFHDIFVPYDYPKKWYNALRQYTEQYLFAAFIYGNSYFKIALSVHNMDKHSKHRDEIRATVEYPKDFYMEGLDSGMWVIKDTSFDPTVEVERPKSS